MDKISFDDLLNLVEKNEIDRVSRILEEHPKFLGAADRRNGWTALHLCAAWGTPEMMRNLLKFEFNINQFADGYYTPVLLAAKKGNLLCLKELVNAGADTTITNTSNRSVISFIHEYYPELRGLLEELFRGDKEEITFEIDDLIFDIDSYEYQINITSKHDNSLVKSARNL